MTQPAPQPESPSPSIVVLDSGFGGLTVARAIRRLLPQLCLRYVADDLAFPYGSWREDALVAHLVALLRGLLARQPADAIVIACNTASTLALPALREAFACPVVGTVPAIKPAAERTRSGLISVLATPVTIRNDYTAALIDDFAATAEVTLVAAERLAELAEAALRGAAFDAAALRSEIDSAFVAREGRRTDTVVLGCTHYPLILERLRSLAPWPVTWIDPAPAIARRLAQVLGAASAAPAPGSDGRATLTLTSGGQAPEAAARWLEAGAEPTG